MDFLPDSGEDCRLIGETMTDDPAGTTHRYSRRRWLWPPSRARRRCRELAQIFDVHPNQITLESAVAGGRGGGVWLRGAEAAKAAVDLKALHAKIGELTLENDFLEGALGKAGLLSAKR